MEAGGELRVDEYVLGSALGTGSTGTAWMASTRAQDGLFRRVVVKLLHPGRAAIVAGAESFLRERDPRVVRYEALERGARASWTAADPVQGRSLSGLLEESTLAARVALLRGAAEALAALHARGLCHGDVRPSNLLVRRERSGALTPLLLDAGVVPIRDTAWHDLPERAPLLYPYLGPEALAAFQPGKPLPTSSMLDVHALGATACALLTGRAPGTLLGERTPDAIARGKERRAVLVALPEPGAPLDLERLNLVLQRTLAPRPEDRPTALWVADALAACISRPLAARRTAPLTGARS